MKNSKFISSHFKKSQGPGDVAQQYNACLASSKSWVRFQIPSQSPSKEKSKFLEMWTYNSFQWEIQGLPNGPAEVVKSKPEGSRHPCSVLTSALFCCQSPFSSGQFTATICLFHKKSICFLYKHSRNASVTLFQEAKDGWKTWNPSHWTCIGLTHWEGPVLTLKTPLLGIYE